MADTVTVVIPSFNRAHTLARAIDSALIQHDTDIEIVVVDDGSTDETKNLLRRYGARVNVVNQERMGAAAARNGGIAVARGEFIAFLDSDDEWLPEKSRSQLRHFRSAPGLGIAGCGAWFVEDGKVYDIHWHPRQVSLRKCLLEGTINTSGIMVRTSCLRALKVHFRTDLKVYEDSELWWRLAARHESLMLPELLVRSHRAGDSLSTSIDMGDRRRSVDGFYEYVLADEAVRLAIGPSLKAFVAHRHYVASCAYYVRRRYANAWAELLAGVRENPLSYRWLKLAAVISLPPTLRPVLKRALERIAQRV